MLIITLLSACSNSIPRVNDNEIYLDIALNATSVIYGVHYEYYLDENPIGGGGTSNANGSAFTKGEQLSVQFLEDHFPSNVDLSGLSIEFYIVNEDGTQTPVKNKISIEADYGNRYSIEIIEETIGSYKAKYSNP